MQGISTNLDAARSIALRVSSPTKGGESTDCEKEPEVSESGHGESVSSVEMSDWGVRVSLKH